MGERSVVVDIFPASRMSDARQVVIEERVERLFARSA
jgi:hypothetical protein